MEEFIKNLESIDKRYMKNFRLNGFADRMHLFAKRSFWPLYETQNIFGTFFAISIRILILSVMIAVAEEFSTPLIIYAVANIVLLIVSSMIMNKTASILLDISSQTNTHLRVFTARQFVEHSIHDNKVVLEDGTMIANESFETFLNRSYNRMEIYRLADYTESNLFSQQLLNNARTCTELSKKIASSQFNNKYGVICSKDCLLETISFFSPSKQVKMINYENELAKFPMLRIEGDKLISKTNYSVLGVRDMNVFDHKPSFFFNDVTRYCNEMTQMAHDVIQSFNSISFLVN